MIYLCSVADLYLVRRSNFDKIVSADVVQMNGFGACYICRYTIDFVNQFL
jgi:hypothetical protein